jgi:hypothetical protein
MDRREQQVIEAEQKAKEPKAKTQESKAKSGISKAISHTIVTKRLVNLFIENMSANDQPHNDEEEK